jgi:hypothetical protein
MLVGRPSVLIVTPSAHRATGLYRTEPGYQDLIKAIGGDGQPSGSISEPARVDLGDDKEVRLTWMVHDVSVWRIDRIYITRSDGIWINTMTDQEGGNPLDQPGSWHRPQNDAALLAVLKSSGILTSSVAPGVDSSSQASPGASAAAAGGSSPPSTRAGIIAGVAALAGLALGAAGLMLRRGRDAGRERFMLRG